MVALDTSLFYYFRVRQHYLLSSQQSSCYSCINKVILWALGAKQALRFTPSLLRYNVKFSIRINIFFNLVFSIRIGNQPCGVILSSCKTPSKQNYITGRFGQLFPAAASVIYHRQSEEWLVLQWTCLLKQRPDERDFQICALKKESHFAYASSLPSFVCPVYLDLKHLRENSGTVCL